METMNPKQPRKPNPQVPKRSRHEEAEFGPGGKGLLMCNDCGAVYFKKHWHHNLERLNNSEASSLAKNNAAVGFARCPACAMIKNKQYEGRVTIVGSPAAKRAELLAVIEKTAKYWNAKDVLDRMIETKNEEGNLVVTTTENQLAAKIGRKIKDVFPGVTTRVAYRGEPSDVCDVAVEFLHE